MSTIAQAETHLSGADQRTHSGGPSSEQETRPNHEQGKENSHQNLDAKDEKSIANKLSQASQQEKRERQAEKEDTSKPTDAARAHGNEPSKGAKIDEQIEQEEAEMLKKKGIQP